MFAKGKYSKAISDRSGMEFPYNEMVREWNGMLVHKSEFEAKHPQLEPRGYGAEGHGLANARPARAETDALAILGPNPFSNLTSCPKPYGNIKISEKIIAASNPNRFIGCKVTSEAIFGVYTIFINPLDFFLSFLNSGKYLPACLIIHTGSPFVFFCFKVFIKSIYYFF